MLGIGLILSLSSLSFMLFDFYCILVIVDLSLMDFLIVLFKMCVLLLYGFHFQCYIIHLCSHSFYKRIKFNSTIATTLILAEAVYTLI